MSAANDLEYKSLTAFLNLLVELIFSLLNLHKFFLYFIFTCIKMSKDSAFRYYQKNKERLQKKVS